MSTASGVDEGFQARSQAVMETSRKIAKRDMIRAIRKEAEQIAANEARLKQIEDDNAFAAAQIATAQACSVNAVIRGNLAATTMKDMMRSEYQQMEMNNAKRTEDVSALNEAIASSRKDIKYAAEKKLRIKEKVREMMEVEKVLLLAEGLNPYIEFRSREVEAEAEMRARKFKKEVLNNEKKITLRLLKEDEKVLKKEKEAKLNFDYEQAHRDSKARSVIEARTSQYISRLTTNGIEVLDPTGHAPPLEILPSQITNIPDYSFGLGKSSRIPKENMKRITERIRKQMKIDKDDFGEYKRLTSAFEVKTKREIIKNNNDDHDFNNECGSENKLNDDSIIFDGDNNNNNNNYDYDHVEARNEQMKRLQYLQNLAGDAGEIPGILDPHSETIIDNVNLKNKNKNKKNDYEMIKKREIDKLLILAKEQGNGIIKKQNETSNNNFTTNPVKYPPITLSKFEKNCFQKAKERQFNRLNNGTEQIAAGKIFKGIAFVADPCEIIFTDFEIGKKYKKNIFFTNTSYSFNSFKLVEMSEDIVEYFTISYERMGRMSAGVSVNIEIIFSPKRNIDIHSAIKFLSETGPGEIPVHCLIRRSAPRVELSILDFGKTIIGQQTILQVKITNSEILSSPFTISRVKYGNERNDEFTLKNGIDYIEESEKLNLTDLDPEPLTEISGEVIDFTEIDKFLSGNYMDGKKYSPSQFKPASSLTSLTDRVTYIATKKIREKKKNQPETFQVILPYTASSKDTGTVDGHSTVNLDVVCMPFETGTIETQFSIIFDNVENASNTLDDKGKIITKEQLILFKVKVQQLPIYIKNNIIDFNCIFFNRIYRKKIEIFNQSNTTNKIEINVPKIFSKFIEISPSTIFIQPKDSNIINIKLIPTEEMLLNLAYFSVLKEGFLNCATLFIPIEIQMAGQDIPIIFYITTIITKSNLSFSTSILNFKNVYLNQNIILPLTVKNGSFLPQKISFVKIKMEIDIQPNDGFAILLPNESIEFSVNFSPSSVTNYSFDLVLYTNYNDKSIIKVIGKGVKSPLLFSEYNLSLRSTSPGERVVESIIIQNIYKLPICYEFFIPDIRFSFLKISPFIFELKPLEKCRVEIEYLPPINILNENAKEWLKKLICDMLLEKGEKEKEERIENNDNNNDRLKIEIEISDKNKLNNKKNKKNGNNDNDMTPKENESESNDIPLIENNDIATNIPEGVKTTFGVFTDFVEDSGFITVGNSFGKMQWLQNLEINNEKTNEERIISNKSEIIGSKVEEKNNDTEKIKSIAVRNEMKDLNKAENLMGVSDKNILTDSITIDNKIKNNSNNIMAESSKKDCNDNNTNNKTNKSNKLKNSNKKNKKEILKTEIAPKIISDIETDYDTTEIKSGIYSSWSLPVFMKIVNPKNKKYGNDSQILTENLIKSNIAEKLKTNFDDEFNINDDNSDILPPLFFSIETVVSDPQFTSDIKTVSFGQIAIGKKCFKSIEITNNCNYTLQLITYGTNAVGPFSVLTPLKNLRPQEFKKIVIEFLPTETGYFTEILEFQNREEIGGHRLRITLRAYGVTPYVTTNGLLPPPSAWGTCKNGSGYLDFGNILVNDTVIQNFTVLNQSAFDVDVTLVRTVCGENSQLTICGLPVFSIIPEAFLLLPGASQIVTVKFRPDRSRVHPYIEEIQILKSSKSIIVDDILRIGMIGKVQENQTFIHSLIPTESVFSNITNFNHFDNFKNDINNVKNKSMINMNKKNDNSLNIDNEIINSINNPFSSIQNNGMKKLFEDSLKYSNTILAGNPSITLEFPNPYDKNTDPTSYTEIDTKTRKMNTSISKNISSSSLKSSDSSKSGGQTLGSVIGGEGRVQFKRILIESLIALDKRTGSTAAGSFEVILSTAARDSGIWSVGSAVFNGKSSQNVIPSIPVPGVLSGTVLPGSIWAVDFFCTLPVPKGTGMGAGVGTGVGTGTGDLCVGSWKSYPADIILTGGWTSNSPIPISSSSSSSVPVPVCSSRIPIILRAYIEL